MYTVIDNLTYEVLLVTNSHAVAWNYITTHPNTSFY